MWLLIDTRNRRSAFFGWLYQDKPSRLWQVGEQDNGLISAMMKRFKPQQLSLAKGIWVVNGPGSFSSVRLGTLVANMLARIYSLPLYAVRGDEVTNGYDQLVQSESKMKPQVYVEPLYDCEPNITMAVK